jgi:hypothetical protein
VPTSAPDPRRPGIPPEQLAERVANGHRPLSSTELTGWLLHAHLATLESGMLHPTNRAIALINAIRPTSETHPRIRRVDAVAELQELRERRSQAAGRVAALEREQRAARDEIAATTARLSEAERTGASKSTITKIEGELSKARQRLSEPWDARINGARQAVRDVDVSVRQFVTEHLAELVEALEAEGRAVADRINSAAAELVAATSEWEAIAARIGQTIASISRPSPGDVSPNRAEQLAREAATFVAGGGAQGPQLSRLNEPWARLLQRETATV